MSNSRRYKASTMLLVLPSRLAAANCVSKMRVSVSSVVVLKSEVFEAANCFCTRQACFYGYYRRVGRTPLTRPVRRPLFVEGDNPFARFTRFAGLHVILERNVDILFYRTPPEFFD